MLTTKKPNTFISKVINKIIKKENSSYDFEFKEETPSEFFTKTLGGSGGDDKITVMSPDNILNNENTKVIYDQSEEEIEIEKEELIKLNHIKELIKEKRKAINEVQIKYQNNLAPIVRNNIRMRQRILILKIEREIKYLEAVRLMLRINNKSIESIDQKIKEATKELSDQNEFLIEMQYY